MVALRSMRRQAVGGELVAAAADGVDERRLALGVDLAAQPADVDVDDVGARVEAVVPDAFEQHGAGDDPALAAHQVFEHLELARQELDAALAAAGGAGDEVELEVGAGEAGLLGAGLGRAAQHRLEAGGELGEGEGLDHVVVGAGAQAADALVDGAHRGQDDRRGLDAGGADRLQQRQAVEVGQHPVEHQGVEAAGDRVHQALAPGGGRLDGVAGLAQALGEIVLGVVVVLDDQDAARHGQGPPGGEGAGAAARGPGLSAGGVRRDWTPTKIRAPCALDLQQHGVVLAGLQRLVDVGRRAAPWSSPTCRITSPTSSPASAARPLPSSEVMTTPSTLVVEAELGARGRGDRRERRAEPVRGGCRRSVSPGSAAADAVGVEAAELERRPSAACRRAGPRA